ncbi:MAG: 3-hydroxy-9,10-secoandrosta,3,5(10)-triene-9,17-dione monooxygenase reductase component [Solirubrobacteraceae bacterium]|nr:3-hydroxy-9,10-secoandrosta,3,5(10)-triene-9,17-dione monooxygenase reductase component [Solirubrobacteraceae bacterium]
MNLIATDRERYRTVIGHFATGVAVITGRGPEGAVGMTTNALTSLSLDPLQLLVCFDNTTRTLPIVRETGRFGVNILRAHHDEMSGVFASKLPPERKFDGVDYTLDHDVPVLRDALAWLVCDLRELLPGGDHTIGIGDVVAMGHSDGEPLVWYRGRYTTINLPAGRDDSE